MSRPTKIPYWATEEGGNVVTGLVPVSATFVEIRVIGGVNYGLIDYVFSGSPDLSDVLIGHRLTANGFSNNANNGSGLWIEGVYPADDKIRIRTTSRTDATLNESGVTGTGSVTTIGANKTPMAPQKQAQGAIPGEKPGAGNENYWRNNVGEWVEWLDAAVPEGFDLIQPKLTAGTNITIVDNEDGTERISASLSIATIDAVGDTYTQASHGFNPLEVVRPNGTNWVKGQGNSIPNCTDCYLVTAAPTANTFVGIRSGRVTITGHGLTPGALYYLSAATAGLLTTTKPVGDTAAPLGFFLPVLFVESANVVHVLGNSYPTFNPILARYVNTGFNADSITFSGLDLVAYGGTLDFEIGVGSATNSGSGGEFQCRINGSSSSAYDYAANWDTGSAWTRQQAASQSNWVIARPSSFSGFDEPVFVKGTLGLSDVDGSASYPMINADFNHKTGMGFSRGQYTSTVANITSVTFGIAGVITWRASASHYANLIWKGKVS